MRSLPWITWCFNHVRTVILILAFLMISGTTAYIIVPKESTPDIKIPMMIVSAHYEGISPLDSERLILRPLEQRLKTIEGIKKITASGYEGGGHIILEFRAGLDVGKARAGVREKVDEARVDLPQDMKDPTVDEINLSLMPVLVVMLSGQLPNRTLSTLADQLKNAIESQVSGVLEAKIRGNQEEIAEIILSPQKMEAYQLSFAQVMTLISGHNQMVSAGRLEGPTGSFSLRVPGLVETISDLLALPILADVDATVRLKDLAHVRKGYKSVQSMARNNGTKAVSLEVSKRLGQNVIHTISAVRAAVTSLQKRWPQVVKVTFAQDDSQRILDMVKDLKNHLISAVLLVMVIMVMSLGLRSALLVGIAIPGSFLTGILMIGLMGFSINIVVLFGLILSIGMLVDGAIIVVEYADRKMAEGQTASQAYAAAASRMLWPVITSITTILVVFLPLIFWPGVVGEFMKYLPYTLLATLTASLVMALVFVPTLGSLFGKLSPHHTKSLAMVRLSESGDLSLLTGFPARYYRALNKALDRPTHVVLGAVGLLVLVLFAYGKLGKGVQFFPDVEPKSAAVLIHARGNTSLEQKDRMVSQVEASLLPMKEFKSIYTTVLQYPATQLAEDVIGKIDLELEDWQKRRPAQEVLDDALARVSHIPGMIVEIMKEGRGPTQGKPIQLELSGHKLDQTHQNFLKLKTYLSNLDGLKDIEDNLPTQDISWEITVDRAQAARYGVTMGMIGNAIKLVTGGIVVSHYRPNESRTEVDITLRFDEPHRSIDDLDRLRIFTPEGMVPLKTFVKRTAQKRLGSIYRANGVRVLTLKADVKPGFHAHMVRGHIRQWAKDHLPADHVTLTFAGEDEDENQTKNFLLGAFTTAIFMMTLILVTQFNSFFSAALILSSIVMSTIGVFIGLIVMQTPFSIVMCGIGIIALAGIIVSNNIILIDTFDDLSATLANKREAIVRTGVQRLRPVILTKLTAILGLLPIMFRLDIDYLALTVHFKSPATLWWQQIAISIVFGVAFASLLTLFVTPCALMMRENYRAKKSLR